MTNLQNLKQFTYPVMAQNRNYLIPDLIYSVCTAADLGVWLETSRNLLNFVPAKHYLLIVPDNDLELFKSVTDRKFSILPESIFIQKLKGKLMEKLIASSIGRLGWYLQQFIKLSVLNNSREHENYVIWDADTVPLKNINFFRESGEVEFFVGTEVHRPYFDLIERILGFGKVADSSFIAQCFPCKGIWAKNFFSYFENKFSDDYANVIINNINFDEASGFSEYETLGSYVYHHFPREVLLTQKKWTRDGSALIGNPSNIRREPYKQLINDYDHISFERWQEQYLILKEQNETFKTNFLKIESNTLPTLDSYLADIFSSGRVRTVVQIGANDGIQNDPLREFLKVPSTVNAFLIEPIPYYVNKLQELYLGRSDINVIGAAVGASEDSRELYFIHPDVADEMNGDGPKNNWAHGQGSFDKATIIHWIKLNAFRGKNYIDRIEHFIKSIISIKVDVLRTDSVLGENRFGLLLVIDVQGFETEVLDGIDWLNPPEWIVIEDDLGKSFDHIAYFSKYGYRWVAGENDKVFSRIS